MFWREKWKIVLIFYNLDLNWHRYYHLCFCRQSLHCYVNMHKIWQIHSQNKILKASLNCTMPQGCVRRSIIIGHIWLNISFSGYYNSISGNSLIMFAQKHKGKCISSRTDYWRYYYYYYFYVFYLFIFLFFCGWSCYVIGACRACHKTWIFPAFPLG